MSNVNVAENPDAIKILKQGIRNSDDVASEYMSKVRPVARGINTETSDLVNNSLTSKINVPETIKAERALYGDYMDRFGNDEIFNFAPISKDIKVYRGGEPKSVLKSMVRNLEKTDPNFKFRTIKDDKTGRIYKDYDHLLSDPERTRYIHTFMDTYNNPQFVTKGSNHGYGRTYKYSVYNNPEHNNLVHDLISQSEKGKTLTKIAREGSHGKESLEKIVMPHTHQTSDAGGFASQSEMFPSYKSTDMITPNNIVVNPNLPHINSLYKGLNEFQAEELDAAKAKKDEEAAAKKAEREKALEDTKNSLNNLKNTFTR